MMAITSLAMEEPMSISCERQADASLALWIDGDLQFDSRDERIYHECLVLPALALATRRSERPLRALICGGGDGLAARELLKSPRLARLDLVDRDPAVLALARAELAALNGGSLADARTHVHVGDAWEHVRACRERGARYDVIVTDLTVPQESSAALLHGVAWYRDLRAVLTPSGVLVANAVSPSATPGAYWAVYQGMRAAGLYARPYRIALPSFRAAGYGPDWGFLLAAPAPIGPADLDDDLPLAAPRAALRDPAHLRRLFLFPPALAAQRGLARPERGDGATLLAAIREAAAAEDPEDVAGAASALAHTGLTSGDWDGLAQDDGLPSPGEDSGPGVGEGADAVGPAGALPPSVAAALVAAPAARATEGDVLRRVLTLVPALQPGQTREMIAAFLAEPARFLATLDLRALVARLLRDAAALPRRVVAELRLLRRTLSASLPDADALLGMGLRVVTIITLVVILVNLAHPDLIYGKGGEGGGHVAFHEVSGISRPGHSNYAFASSDDIPQLIAGTGFRGSDVGRTVAVDEYGTAFPARTYRYYAPPFRHSVYRYDPRPRQTGPVSTTVAAYALTPEADVLADGTVVIALGEGDYERLGPRAATVVDGATGLPVMDLAPQPAQLWRVARELERQEGGLHESARAKRNWMAWYSWLGFLPWHDDDVRELANLDAMANRLAAARAALGAVPANDPGIPSPPVHGAVELIGGVWMLPHAAGVLVQRGDGPPAYMDASRWSADRYHLDPLHEPYPAGFRAVLIRYLGAQIAGNAAIVQSLQAELADAETNAASLQNDLNDYQASALSDGGYSLVDYGTEQITADDAIARTQSDIATTQREISRIGREIDALPTEHALMGQLRLMLKRGAAGGH